MKPLYHAIRLDRSISTPLCYQIKDYLMQYIRSGELPDGEMIPPEEELCELLNVSRPTVRQALTDLVHEGYKLLSHPLSGSIKPNETPFKSILISAVKEPLDYQSVEIIENSIVTCDKFKVKFPVLPEQVRKDFQLLDCTLIKSALSQI